MRGVRGQLTIFVIIGMVLLFAVGLFFLLVNLRQQGDAANEGSQSTIDATAAATVSATVASCLDTVVNDELRILGQTGGLPQQDGFPSALTTIGTNERRVLYGVTRNRNDAPDHLSATILPNAYDPPEYPAPHTPVRIEESDQYYDADLQRMNTFPAIVNGYFGDVNLPAICDTAGPNGVGTPFRCRNYPSNPVGTLAPSVQEGLTKRVAQRVQACASPTAIGEAIGKEITSIGTPEVNITFTPNNLLVMLTYHLEIQGSTTTTLQTTPRQYRVRLMPLLRFATELAREESRNVTFDPIRHAEHLPSWNDGFTVLRTTTLVTDPTPLLSPTLNTHADIITIIDGSSIVDGESFAFSFLVEHRPPMVNALTENERASAFPSLLSMGGSQHGGTMSLVHLGADPDGGDVDISLTRDSDGGKLTVTDADGETDWEVYSEHDMCNALGDC